MGQLQRIKAVFSEPRAAGDAFDTAIRRYYEAVDGGQGGLFMAVCRGKVRVGGRGRRGADEGRTCQGVLLVGAKGAARPALCPPTSTPFPPPPRSAAVFRVCAGV